MDTKPLRLLLVDDDEDDFIVTRELVTEIGSGRYEIDWVATFDEGLDAVKLRRHDVYFFDYHLGERTGLDLLREALANGCAAPIILLTGLDDQEVDVEAMKAGAADYLIKGQINAPLLERTIRHAVERFQASEALRESEERYRDLFENANDLIQCVDIEGRLLYVNRAWRDILGYSEKEISLLTMIEVVHPDTLGQYMDFRQSVVSGEKVGKAEFAFVTKSGKKVTVEGSSNCRHVDGKPVSIRGVFRDVTDRKKLEERLLQSEKMEAVGRLAGGVAHDFNNVLTAIVGYSEMLIRGAQPQSIAFQHAQQVKKAAERAASLTSQLLAFSRKQTIQPKVLNLNEIVSEMDAMLRRLIGENVELVTLLGSDLGCVKADQGQIEQVLVNLAVNARDAMPNGGRLTIQTANVTFNETDVEQNPGAVCGPYVQLTVSDSGTGISEEVKAHIFEPFFTTKELGRGTGLGLATCYGVVKQSNGFIHVASEMGQGATIIVHLPSVAEAAHIPFKRGDEDNLPVGNETVLVAEDEPAIRELYVSILREQGYTVLEGDNGEKALRVAQQRNGQGIDLLLTDVVMPLMGGKELADRIAATYPRVKIIFASGYTNNAFENDGVLDSNVAFLQKPFTPSTLSHKVREVLDQVE